MDYDIYSEETWSFVNEQLRKPAYETLEYKDKLEGLISDSIGRIQIAKNDNNDADFAFHMDVLNCVRDLVKDSKNWK